MMNAEVTAENRPACDTDQRVFTQTPRGTYEDESRVQIFSVSLEEFLIVLFSYLAIVIVELNLMVPLS